jgi:serine/threonine protein kinase
VVNENDRRLGEYELLEKIASGGMAEVFRARRSRASGFEKILVIKRILNHLAEDSEFINLFVDEARIAVHLRDANIVQIFDLGERDGQYFMAMEYVEGLDLSRLLTRASPQRRFPIKLALLICAEVLKGLQFAHNCCNDKGEAMNIVHCDISPQNILISYAGEVKLTDFGISRAAFQHEEQHQVIRGKYAYMAPEQVMGGTLDQRTDLFALSIVLFEMLTGYRLFKTKDRNKTLLKVRKAEVPSPRSYRAEISEELEKVLYKGLSRYPKDRFQNAEEMLIALGEIISKEALQSTNQNLSEFIKEVGIAGGLPNVTLVAQKRNLPPSSVVILAAEAIHPPRNQHAPRAALSDLVQVWEELIIKSGGEVWERYDGSLLAVWVAKTGLGNAVRRSANVSKRMHKAARECGYQPGIGISPGVARISSETKRPSEGWELEGPFYLSRWMMNFSVHRGRILITQVFARQLSQNVTLLGRMALQTNQYINIYEI